MYMSQKKKLQKNTPEDGTQNIRGVGMGYPRAIFR